MPRVQRLKVGHYMKTTIVKTIHKTTRPVLEIKMSAYYIISKLKSAVCYLPAFAAMSPSFCCTWYSWKRWDIRCVIFRNLSMHLTVHFD